MRGHVARQVMTDRNAVEVRLSEVRLAKLAVAVPPRVGRKVAWVETMDADVAVRIESELLGVRVPVVWNVRQQEASDVAAVFAHEGGSGTVDASLALKVSDLPDRLDLVN